MDVRDWCSEHIKTFYEVSAAVGRVTDAMNHATQTGRKRETLDAPDVRQAFGDIVTAAQACSSVVNRAINLPEIPDPGADAQFRTAMRLRAEWAAVITDAATAIDAAKLDRANVIGAEATREGTAITAYLKRAWPDTGV